jgi:protein-S-isoprenylcysteine O-methyltransferase Ste14
MHESALLFPVCWGIWCGIWAIASRNVKKTVQHETSLSRLANTAPIWLAAILLAFPDRWLGPLAIPLLPSGPAWYWIGAVLTLVGLGFAVWARYHIGRNWSGVVTVKEDHMLIRSGPYAIVRHPIYTGLLLAFIGTAVGRGRLGGLLAVAFMLYAVLRRVQVEEKWMTEAFGSAYDDYRTTTPGLLPFGRTGRGNSGGSA